ncbi:transcriptional regulator [Streptomyces anulatus]|uniref:transcriptional regulator n=1 Tax=Streptomyces anulatus TaxID=1892 RepID=UPI001C252BCE|nr:transcriptional regulator [Streptomyces anulatus]
MSERIFDALEFRAAIRASGLKQSEVGEPPVSLNESVISRYCSGALTPPPEKLPLLAERVAVSLDALAPRSGLPDLKDLRCDAGIQQKDTAQYTRSKSAMPVRAAENGLRRLKEEFEAPLADAYGVTVAELKAAQERSFGNIVPAVRPAPARRAASDTPRSLSEKITYLLEQTYAAGSRPTDAELSRKGNAKAGRILLSEDLVRALRMGEASTDDAEVLGALAAAMDAPPVFFTSDNPEEAARIVAGIRSVALGVMAARGDGGRPLTDEWLDFIASSIQDIIDDQGGPPRKA